MMIKAASLFVSIVSVHQYNIGRPLFAEFESAIPYSICMLVAGSGVAKDPCPNGTMAREEWGRFKCNARPRGYPAVACADPIEVAVSGKKICDCQFVAVCRRIALQLYPLFIDAES